MTPGSTCTKSRPVANLVDLLGVKGQPEQVADCLLETGEDQERPALRQLSNEQLEGRPLAGHPRRVVAGHHRQLIKVREHAQGIRVRPK